MKSSACELYYGKITLQGKRPWLTLISSIPTLISSIPTKEPRLFSYPA
jgi:hypothetical protein